jgi:hypothetical protein
MRVVRGLLRLWLAFSVLWIGFWGFVTWGEVKQPAQARQSGPPAGAKFAQEDNPYAQFDVDEFLRKNEQFLRERQQRLHEKASIGVAVALRLWGGRERILDLNPMPGRGRCALTSDQTGTANLDLGSGGLQGADPRRPSWE